MGLGCLVRRRSKVGGSRSRVEEARKDWLDERAEDNLSAPVNYNCQQRARQEICEEYFHVPSLRKSHPKDENKFEGVVEG